MIAVLLVLNIRGIRESSLVNEVIGLVDLLLEMSVVIFGFILAGSRLQLLHQKRGKKSR